MDTFSDINQLRQFLNKQDQLYYKKGDPHISDYQYDTLKKHLEFLEKKNHKQLDLFETPSPQKIGDDRIEGFVLYTHKKPMLSLDNTYNKEELLEFDKRLKNLISANTDYAYTIEPKIDGVAISLVYENGRFVRAVTRGNGVQGDDVTHNVLTIKSIPQNIEQISKYTYLEIRGEVFIDIHTFNQINQSRNEEGLSLYANPRNLAAGSIKLLDANETKKRPLSFIAYGLGHVEPENLCSTLIELHDLLKTYGFHTQNYIKKAQNIEEIWSYIEDLNHKRHTLPYSTDGVVIKLNNIHLHELAGNTAKSPRWAISYKFAPEQAQTYLKSISIQIGRTGVLTPVAELEPVLISGTTVSRATLHNFEEIKRKDIREKDTVYIEKAGEIIPCVVSVVIAKRPQDSHPFVMPNICTACGSEIIKIKDEIAFRCVNISCPPQVRRRIVHFASRVAMDIPNLGVAVINELVDKKLVYDIADLYSLELNNLLILGKSVEKSSINLLAGIQNSKERPLWRLIHGLGIQHVGAQSSKNLAKHFGSLYQLTQSTLEELQNIQDIGPIVASSIIEFFKNPVNQKIIERLQSYGLKTTETIEKEEDQKTLSGKIFALTGTLESLSREEIKKSIEDAGGKISSSLSKKVNYLIAGSNPGSKLTQAQQLNIIILNEKEFYDLLKQSN